MNATTRYTALGAATALALAAGSITAMGAAITANAGVKYWDNQNFKSYDIADYASGTVWFYDGIRNAGPDTPHDSAATTWANLGSGGATYDLARTERGNSWAEDGVWTDDGYVCKGRHVFAATGLSYTVPTSYTVQMLVDAKGAEQFVSWNAYLFCGSWNNFALYFATGDNSPKAKSISLNTQDQVSTSTSQGERPYLYNNRETYSYVTAMLDGNAKTATVFDGTSVPDSGAGFHDFGSGATLATASIGTLTLGAGNGNGNNLYGTLKSFRYYERVLSTEELAWNRVLDETRFFGRQSPIPATNLVVVSSNPMLQGNLPAGNYFVTADGQDGGVFAFSAPASTNIEDRTYRLTRVLVSEWNGATGDWGSPTQLTPDAACLAIPVDVNGKTRIELEWAEAGRCYGLVPYEMDDYVWDGLVWFYDGIRNQGIDAPHDSSALTWANLGSGGATYDLARTERGNSWAEDGVWTDDGYVCKGRHVFAATGLSYTVPTSYTVQMLVDAKGAEQFVSWNAYLFCGSWNNFALYFATGDNSPKAKSISLNTQDQVSTSTSQGERPYLYNNRETYSYVTAMLDGNAKTATVFDGTSVPDSGAGFHDFGSGATLATASIGTLTLGAGNGNGNNLYGTLKSFRYYERVLSESELLRNRIVDGIRYDGALPVTNIVVAAEGFTATPAPGAYFVEGSYEFTATAGADGAPTGYRLQDWDEATGQWTNPRNYDGTSYTHDVSASAAKVKLTWRKRNPFVITVR